MSVLLIFSDAGEFTTSAANLELPPTEQACYLFPMRLAFLDSGIGGLTVLGRALAALPADDFIYFADTRHAPYGMKPKADVQAHVLAAADFLSRQSIDALVVACNTATAVAIQALRERFAFPVIGMEPAVKPALIRNTGKKVLVFATSLTLRENKLETLIANLDTGRKVECRELDGLVAFAERFDFDAPSVHAYLAGKFADIRWADYESAVLGCTHFIFYRDAIQRLAGERIGLLDGNVGTVNHLVRVLAPLRNGGTDRPTPADARRVTFFTSGGTAETPERIARLLPLLEENR
jgi:glutamate racemase